MSYGVQASKGSVARLRTKLFAAMMIIVATLTGLGLYFAQRKVTTDAEQDLQQNFQAELTSLHKLEELRHAALAERCADLAQKPRIHAALEDNALDLLYPSAKDELRDLMEGEEPPPQQAGQSLHAKFYRFLNGAGAVLKAPSPNDFGGLDPTAEAQLTLNKLRDKEQIGYIQENPDIPNGIVDEVIAEPIFSTDTGEVISALVIGFKPLEVAGKRASAGMKSGLWVDGRMQLPALSRFAQESLRERIAGALANSDRAQNNFRVTIDGAPQLVFYKRLNPDSLYPPAYEICVYPLADAITHLRRLRWQIGGAGALLLLGGFVVSHVVAGRLAKPVEAVFASTAEELKRSTRYSADASHQLKSPVTFLRIGLEKLLARKDFQPEVYEDVSALLHQTRHMTSVIDDLLLLSQMDAGHLEIATERVNLSQLIDEWLDDLSALPDSPEVKIEKKFPADLYVAGERRYISLIVQNLLENARKYNRPGGRMRVTARTNAQHVAFVIGNSGTPIPPGANVFERFHRGMTRAAVSGHGIGLNLARNLARLQGGDVRLLGSEKDWTEFEVRFRMAESAGSAE